MITCIKGHMRRIESCPACQNLEQACRDMDEKLKAEQSDRIRETVDRWEQQDRTGYWTSEFTADPDKGGMVKQPNMKRPRIDEIKQALKEHEQEKTA